MMVMMAGTADRRRGQRQPRRVLVLATTLLVAALVLLLLPHEAGAAPVKEYHVNAASGSNKNDGSKDKPWQTLSYALSGSAGVGPGDAVWLHGDAVAAGDEKGVLVLVSGTTPRPIQVRGVRGDDGTLPALKGSPCLRMKAGTIVQNVQFSDLSCSGVTGAAVDFSAGTTSGLLFRGWQIWHSDTAFLFDGNTMHEALSIRNCNLWSIRNSAIVFGLGVQDATVSQTIFRAVSGGAIVAKGAGIVNVLNNTLMSVGASSGYGMDLAASNITVNGNRITKCGSHHMRESAAIVVDLQAAEGYTPTAAILDNYIDGTPAHQTATGGHIVVRGTQGTGDSMTIAHNTFSKSSAHGIVFHPSADPRALRIVDNLFLFTSGDHVHQIGEGAIEYMVPHTNAFHVDPDAAINAVPRLDPHASSKPGRRLEATDAAGHVVGDLSHLGLSPSGAICDGSRLAGAASDGAHFGAPSSTFPRTNDCR